MESLDTVVDKKIKPMLDAAMKTYFGVRVEELTADVSDKLLRSPLLEITIDLSLSYKKAKQAFRRHYIQRLIQLHFGNVAHVARLSGMDRRSIHRMIKTFGVTTNKFRKELHKQDFYLQQEVRTIIEGSTEQLKESIAPQKYRAFYDATPALSKNIAKELPLRIPTLDEAEAMWERRFMDEAMKSFGPSPVAVARKIGLRYETVHRKLARHGLL